MIYHLSLFLKKYHSFFNFLQYVSVRAMLSLMTSLLLSIFLGRWFINSFSDPFRSKVREYTPEGHQVKNNTPTMGGIFIVCSIFLSVLLWCNLTSPRMWILMLCLALFAAIGFWDDYCKIKKLKGIFANKKFFFQVASAFLASILWIYFCEPGNYISIPVLKNTAIYLGPIFILWSIFIIVGTSNAVNLTDGLDGLATGALIYNFATFGIIAYLAGHALISSYLHMPFAQTSEIAIVACSFIGALLGFLWYNTYPAQVFMGDVGSLSLGAALGLMCLMTKQEVLLAISGGLFVLETVSVILQVLSFKYFKKRIFKMAPIHHHFELLGWPESKITVRFAIISLVLSLFSLMILKVR